MRISSALVLVLGIIGGPAASAYAGPEARAEAQRSRMAEDEVRQSLLAGLVTLADRRIKDRPGKHHPYYDSCSTGDGCLSLWPFADFRLPLGVFTPLLWPKVQNYPGEWPSGIHALTAFLPNTGGQAPVTIPDSNMFVTANILYPLVFIKDPGGPFAAMISDALASITHYRRGNAYSFWRQRESQHRGYQIVGPLNIPARLLDVLGLVIKAGAKPPADHAAQMRDGWMEALVDKEINPVGAEAFFNIPTDADDTALAMIAYKLFSNEHDGEITELATTLLDYRDLNRVYEDGRDAWKGKDSGAFLTWLKEEDLPLEAAMNPATGSIPFGINNVDCVVNANALFAMGLAGQAYHPAVISTLGVLNRAINVEAWPYCGLYYPHRMMLPYTLTRAYRDGGLRHPGMAQTLARIAVRLIADQKEVAARDKKHQGAFSGGADQTYDLATALALNSLLNIGRSIPEALGIAADYDRAIASGVNYLLNSKQLTRVRYADDLGDYYRPDLRAAMWQPGLFFSASIQKAASWRSESYTAAIVVEALAKYLLAWDYGQESIGDNSTLHVFDLY